MWITIRFLWLDEETEFKLLNMSKSKEYVSGSYKCPKARNDASRYCSNPSRNKKSLGENAKLYRE